MEGISKGTDYWRTAVEGIHEEKVEEAKSYLRDAEENWRPTDKAIIIQVIAKAVDKATDDDIRSLIEDLIDETDLGLNFVNGHYYGLTRTVLERLNTNTTLQEHGNPYQLKQLELFVNPPSRLTQFRNLFPRRSQLRPGHRTWDYG